MRAIALGLVGPLVQVGATVNIGPFAGGTKVTLPAGALMLDYRQGSIVYRKGTQVRVRRVATGKDTLLRVIGGQAVAGDAVLDRRGRLRVGGRPSGLLALRVARLEVRAARPRSPRSRLRSARR